MAWKRWALVGLTAMTVAASVVAALGQGLLIPQQNEIPVSPATPGTLPGSLSNQTTGINPITGLPCSGQGSLAVSGAGSLADAATPPPGSDATSTPTAQLPSVSSVFGTTTTLGSC